MRLNDCKNCFKVEWGDGLEVKNISSRVNINEKSIVINMDGCACEAD